ncbi:MAG: hypothetical protein WC852_02740 [Candidatus Nanoarchaeia archaeon]|jgi:hypothetical protein
MENESLPYNIITGVLPECLQMDTISEILSSKLRKLPTGKTTEFPLSRRIEMRFDDTKPRQRMVWHTSSKKKFFWLGAKVKKRISTAFFLALI